jgi:hypothetical protein
MKGSLSEINRGVNPVRNNGGFHIPLSMRNEIHIYVIATTNGEVF